MTNIVATLEDGQVGRAALEVGEELCCCLGNRVMSSSPAPHKQYYGAAVAHKQSSGVMAMKEEVERQGSVDEKI